MSKGSTPVHTTGSPFDSYYDPEFTAEISAKMHVPDKICVVEGLQNSAPVPSQRDEFRNMMNVPERILVAGDNKHYAVRESVPEFKFDRSFPTSVPNYVLDAPPNVLTVDEFPYPSAEFSKPAAKVTKKQTVVLDRSSNGIDLNESSINAAPEDEIVFLRKQIRHLSRRVLVLEQEGQQHQQREMILYTIGITYFVFKGLLWLHKHF